MNLLLVVLCAAFFSALRRGGREVPVRTIPLVLMCAVVAIGYLSQRML